MAIIIKDKDLKLLGIKRIELDSKGNVISVVGVTGKIDKKYNWNILGIQYCGG